MTCKHYSQVECAADGIKQAKIEMDTEIEISKENILYYSSIIVREASISTLHVSLISDNISWVILWVSTVNILHTGPLIHLRLTACMFHKHLHHKWFSKSYNIRTPLNFLFKWFCHSLPVWFNCEEVCACTYVCFMPLWQTVCVQNSSQGLFVFSYTGWRLWPDRASIFSLFI